ncbi:MAG TPA: hypothetical protein VFL83_21570 [Anaeromyxobacter sp.]|nr:hypothetical protein [Anaeromyxobacter sp.]
MAARTLTYVLGLWQFFAAFAIPRERPSFWTAWSLGLLAAVLAVVGMTRRRARYGGLAVGLLVAASALVLPHETPIAWWNDVAVGSALAALSLVPGTMYSTRRRRATA